MKIISTKLELFDENNNQGILDISIVDYNKLNTVKKLLGGSNA